MKIKKEHYESLKKCIKDTGFNLKHLKEEYNRRELSETRFLWDLFWRSNWSTNYREYYNLYNDTHIETAIRKAVKELS